MRSESPSEDDGSTDNTAPDTPAPHRSTTFRRCKRDEKLKLRLLQLGSLIHKVATPLQHHNNSKVPGSSVSNDAEEDVQVNVSEEAMTISRSPDPDVNIPDSEAETIASPDNVDDEHGLTDDKSTDELETESTSDQSSTVIYRLEHQANGFGGGGDPDDPGDDDDYQDDDSYSDQSEENNYWHDLQVPNPVEDGNNDMDNDDGEPSDPEDDDPESDGDDDDDNENRNLSFNPQRLNAICYLYANHSVKEILAIVLALFDRHSWTYEALIGCLQLLNTIFGGNYFPKSKKTLWKALNRKGLGMKKHAYCKRCKRGLGRYKDLGNRVQCPGVMCGRIFRKKEIPYFMELDLKAQLGHFLARPDAAQLLFHKANRVKHNENALEDIYDGSEYKRLQNGNQPVLGENDFSYSFNNDGFRVTTSSSIQVNPVYIKLNELPMNVRQKHLFLAGVWVDRGDPEMFMYLRQCLVRQGNRLARHGITWNAPGKGVITSKFIATCCTVDAKARCIIMNMQPPTGFFGCTFCPIQGIQANGVKFPMEENMPAPRTREQLKALMEVAHANHAGHEQGVQGRSALKFLRHFNLGTGMSTDDLHPLFEGVVQFHMDKLLTDNAEPYYIGAPGNIALINARLLSMKPPTLISRTPRGIDTRAKWRGHEWRNWIFYYAYPCLTGLLPQRFLHHLLKLSRAIFLVSRDSVTEADLEEAEVKLTEYVTDFQAFFGVECMRFNVHVLLHVVRAVRCWGPTFVHSTFNFESWNMKLKKHVKSMKDPIWQIVNRHLLTSFIAGVPFDPVNFSPDVQLEVSSILLKSDLKTAEKVGTVYLLGTGEPGMVSEEERFALVNVNIRNIQGLTRYKRALHGRLEIRSTEYTRSGKNNNAHILSWNGTFYRVHSIAKVSRVNIPDTCLLFVKKVELTGHANIVTHFGKVALVQNHHVEVCLFESVRAFAIHVECAGLSLIVPMPNSCEID